MKATKKIVMGVIALLLVVYSVFTANRAQNLEDRLALVKTSYKELEARHRAFKKIVLANELSSAAITQMRLELLREERNLPPATVAAERPATVERNLPTRPTIAK